MSRSQDIFKGGLEFRLNRAEMILKASHANLRSAMTRDDEFRSHLFFTTHHKDNCAGGDTKNVVAERKYYGNLFVSTFTSDVNA